jgi:hypothetical protein
VTPELPRRAAEQQLWRCLEAAHAVVYFDPAARDTWRQLGLRGFWMGYFASRSAPLGTAAPQLVTALFHGFAPRMVDRALPQAWTMASPEDVLDTRRRLAHRALRPHTGGDEDPLAAELEALLAWLDLAGRPLAAAHAALPRPEDPVTRLWHAASVLREYRGDGHVAALVAADVDGAQSHIWHAATGLLGDNQRENRGYTEAEWIAARGALQQRGWLDATGALTDTGRAARADVEHRTDAAAAHAFASLTDDALRELLVRLLPVAISVLRTGAVPYPNAMGVPAPASAERT